MVVYWRVSVTPVGEDNNWNEEGTFILNGIRNPALTTRIGDDRDTFEFKVNNIRDKYLSKFKPRDRIEIRRAKTKEGLDSVESILMIGTIMDVPVNKDNSTNELTISGFNFTEIVANALSFGDYQKIPINEALRLALESINAYTDNYLPDNRFVVTWHPDNPELNINDLPYPNMGEDVRNKPFRYLIAKYSTSVETGTVRHYYFVDKDNKLVWRPVSSEANYEFGDNDKYISLKKEIDTNGIVNYVIVKGGLDAYNKQIQRPVINHSSTAKYGQKFLFVTTMAQESQKLIDRDMKSLGIEDGKLPFPTAGVSFTTTWVSSVTGDFVTVSTNEAYNGALKAHIENLLEIEGRRILEGREFGIMQLQLEFNPAKKSWFLGDLVRFKITGLVEPGFGLDKDLRVVECQYTHTTDSFTLAEDVGTV